jgi:aspartate 1-decarboxylase
MILRHLLKSKLHNVVVTDAILHYKGSIGIDKNWLKKVDIIPGEKVYILNKNNGERFETYAIEEKAGSHAIKLYGPAARRGLKGDVLVILSYALVSDDETKTFKAKVFSL